MVKFYFRSASFCGLGVLQALLPRSLRRAARTHGPSYVVTSRRQCDAFVTRPVILLIDTGNSGPEASLRLHRASWSRRDARLTRSTI